MHASPVWGGVVPGNSGEIAGLLEDGVLGFKSFLVPSGVEEFQHVTEADLREAMPRLNGAVLLVHAELPEPLGTCEGNRYGDWLRSRPDAVTWRQGVRAEPRSPAKPAANQLGRLDPTVI